MIKTFPSVDSKIEKHSYFSYFLKNTRSGLAIPSPSEFLTNKQKINTSLGTYYGEAINDRNSLSQRCGKMFLLFTLISLLSFTSRDAVGQTLSYSTSGSVLTLTLDTDITFNALTDASSTDLAIVFKGVYGGALTNSYLTDNGSGQLLGGTMRWKVGTDESAPANIDVAGLTNSPQTGFVGDDFSGTGDLETGDLIVYFKNSTSTGYPTGTIVTLTAGTYTLDFSTAPVSVVPDQQPSDVFILKNGSFTNISGTGNFSTSDTIPPVFSAVSPSSSSTITTANVGYTLSEALDSGTVTFTRTGGSADSSSPHEVVLTGTELDSGVRSSAALTNAPSLVSGAIYTISFNGKDAAGNSASTVSSTSVTFGINTWNGASWSFGTAPTKDDEAIIDGTYKSMVNGTFASKSLTINGGDSLLIGSGTHVVIEDSLINNGVVRVYSGGGMVTRGGVSGGEYFFEKITTFGKSEGKYSILGCPVKDGKTDSLGSLIYKYDETVKFDTTSGVEGLNRFVQISASETMKPAKGYFSAYTGTVRFNGVPNHGDIKFPLSYTNHSLAEMDSSENDYEGFNLIANPYPAAIKLSSFLNGNMGKMSSTIWIWDDGGSQSGRRSGNDYLTINTLGVSSGGSGRSGDWNNHIGSFQGFFVKALKADSVAFADSMKVLGENLPGAFFRQKDEKQTLKLELSYKSGKTFETLIGFMNDATEGADYQYDAPLLVGSNQSIQLFSSLNKMPHAIQAVSPIDAEVKLGVKVSEKGVYAISPIQMNIDFTDEIYLVDHFSNIIHDLKEGSYEFFSTAGTFKERFTLHAGSIQEKSFNESNIHVFGEEGQLVLRSKMHDQIESIRIFDLAGHELKSFSNVSLNNGEWKSRISQEGILIVAALTSDDIKIVKLKL